MCIRDSVYYKCGNNHKPGDHPPVRWRERELERAVLDELDSIRIPQPRLRAWFRDALEAMFADLTRAEAERRRLLAKRRSELAGMQDRLLNAFLQGVVDEAAFNAKAAELRSQLAEVQRQLDRDAVTEESGRLALSVFDFSQNLADIWRGSNFASRRAILECVSSNRLLSDTSLVLVKRRPFDYLAERPFLNNGRGDWI